MNTEENPKKKRKTYRLTKDKHLTPTELRSVQTLVGQMLQKHLREFLPLALLLATGCRRSEAILLKVSDIDFSDKTVYIHATKDSEDRALPLNFQLINHLKKYIDKHNLNPDDLLFWSVDKEKKRVALNPSNIMRAWHKVRPTNKGVHCLRHTFALELYKRRRDINLVKIALGHRNIQNTMIYVQYDFQTKELRRLILGDTKSA